MSRQRVRLAHASVDPLPSKQHRETVGTLDPMALRIGLLYTASECADERPRRGASSKEIPISVSDSQYLVALSILFATSASYAALELGGRDRTPRGMRAG